MDFSAGSNCLKPAHATTRPVSVVIDDMAVLLSAVRDRLRMECIADLAAGPLPQEGDPVSMLRIKLVDCVSALDLLHASLGQQVTRLRELERDDALYFAKAGG